jgi:hypothetical protein
MFSRTTLWVTLPPVCFAAALFVRDYHMRLFAGLEGFSRRPGFSLMDSLPALSPGLSELEAFKFTADSSSKTNADRSIWLDDSLGFLFLEYYSGKLAFDSTTFHLWTSDSVIESRTLKNSRTLAWVLPYRRVVHSWTEIVGVYLSRPRFLEFKSADTSVMVFEAVEGKTLHVVRRRYRDRRESPVTPDTTYPADGAGGLTLLARGDALAIVNPASESVRLRIIRIHEKRWNVCEVKGRTTQVYRSLLRNLRGPVLAHTSAGESHAVLFKKTVRPVFYFWLPPR